jgi:hypothetical protein
MRTKFLLENLEERLVGRPRRRWEDIGMDLREIGWEGGLESSDSE